MLWVIKIHATWQEFLMRCVSQGRPLFYRDNGVELSDNGLS